MGSVCPRDWSRPTEALRQRLPARHMFAAGERVLDVGCGEGRFAAALARSGAHAGCRDRCRRRAAAARARRHPELDLRQVQPEGAWPLEDASFDAVWAGEVIEHVADTAGWLSEAAPRAALRWLLLLSTPDHGRLRDAPLGACARVHSRPTSTPAPITCASTRAARSPSCSRTSAFTMSNVRSAGGRPARGGGCWRAPGGRGFTSRTGRRAQGLDVGVLDREQCGIVFDRRQRRDRLGV